MTTELRQNPQAKPTDRFKLTDKPMVSPAKCACCGAVDRPVVDFDMTIQFYGAVLLCVSCLGNAAQLIDMVPAVELHAAEFGATQSLSNQLSALGMRTISDEQFESILSAADVLGLAIGDLKFPISPGIGQATKETLGEQCEGQERLFDFDSIIDSGQQGIIEFPDSLTEQNSDAPVSKGSNLVSASNSDGDFNF